MSIADTDAWDSVVRSVYGLQDVFYESGALRIKFFRGSSLFFGSYLATAPYLTDGGVQISAPASDQDVENIHALRQQRKSDYALVRTRQNIFESCAERVHIDRSQFSFSLDLTNGADFVWNKLIPSKTRNQIRKGLKADATVRLGGTELGPDFFKVISRAWRDLGTPIHTRAFFDGIVSAFGGRAKYLILYLQGRPVSAALTIVNENTIYHPYACTLKGLNALSLNNALYWRIIQHACDLGCETFDMGRSAKDSGTYRYKLSWGAAPVQLYYSYVMAEGHEPPDIESSVTRAMVNAWKYLPLPVSNRLGPGLIKNVL